MNMLSKWDATADFDASFIFGRHIHTTNAQQTVLSLLMRCPLLWLRRRGDVSLLVLSTSRFGSVAKRRQGVSAAK